MTARAIGEANNYSPYVRSNATPPKAVTFHGAEYAMGNTEEVLKHRNLGTYRMNAECALQATSTTRPATDG